MTETGITDMRWSFIGILLSVMFVLAGCSGMRTAYKERICWEHGFPGECREYRITLSCPEVPVSSRPLEPTSLTTVFVRPLEGPDNMQVGVLFSQYGGRPIYLQEETAWETLQKDLTTILRSYGLDIREDIMNVDRIVEGNVKFLDVRTEDPGFFALKATTKAVVGFEVKLMDADGNMLWKQEFYGEDEIRVAYALLRDSEELLGRAYCQALEQFVTAFESTWQK